VTRLRSLCELRRVQVRRSAERVGGNESGAILTVNPGFRNIDVAINLV